MAWRKNRRALDGGYRDLAYLPRGPAQWDATLAAVAYAMRRTIENRPPDLCAWAARHGVRASARYRQLGERALVLWHGTSRERASKIAEHGLFHKRGLWTTVDPRVAHNYARWRSEQNATQGAMVCIVLDADTIEEGRDFEHDDPSGTILRFHSGLPADVVEYVLLSDAVHFAGERPARSPAPWPRARFRRRGAGWEPCQRVPVRYSDEEAYSTLDEFAGIVLARLARELKEFAAVEAFSTLYACTEPWDALPHRDVFGLLNGLDWRRRHGDWRVLRLS